MKRERGSHSTSGSNRTHKKGVQNPFAGASAGASGGAHRDFKFSYAGASGGYSGVPKRIGNSKAMDITAVAINANSTTAVFSCLNFPQVGAAFYNRVGNDIFMKSVRLRGFFKPSGAATGNTVPSFCRIMIVYDRQTNGAFPALADVIADYNTAGATTTNALSGINMNNRGRFLVLMDNQVILPAVGAAGATPASNVLSFTGANDKGDTDTQGVLCVNRYQKLRGLPTLFKASTGAIGDISTGGLYLITVGDDAAAGCGYTFTYSSRLKYADE